MRALRIAGIALVGLIAVAAAGLALVLSSRPSLEPTRAWRLDPAPPDAPGVTVAFFGVATLVVRDGATTLLVDGFFSRPGRLALLGSIAPDPERIDAGLRLAGVEHADAIFTAHSHFDHALDTGEVAKRTGALVVGSSSTANVARGAGVPETQIRVTRPGDVLAFGAFRVHVLPGRHFPLKGRAAALLGRSIDAPLVPPARLSAWLEGRSEVLLFEHPRGSFLVVGSAGFVPGALDDVRADTVLLGVGGLGGETEAYREAYWKNVVLAVHAQRVWPIHWDDFTRPIDEPLLPPPSIVSKLDVTLRFLSERSAADGVAIGWLPLARPVRVF